jgi:hypothetical protein
MNWDTFSLALSLHVGGYVVVACYGFVVKAIKEAANPNG